MYVTKTWVSAPSGPSQLSLSGFLALRDLVAIGVNTPEEERSSPLGNPS
jgi:hypothetical protein